MREKERGKRARSRYIEKKKRVEKFYKRKQIKIDI